MNKTISKDYPSRVSWATYLITRNAFAFDFECKARQNEVQSHTESTTVRMLINVCNNYLSPTYLHGRTLLCPSSFNLHPWTWATHQNHYCQLQKTFSRLNFQCCPIYFLSNNNNNKINICSSITLENLSYDWKWKSYLRRPGLA